MDNQEAKFILGAYRPGGQDADDPHFRAALEQARHDPALGDWFRNELEFDGAVAEKLRAIRPPADLKSSILVGARVGEPARWRMPLWAVAAALALCAGMLALWMNRAPEPTFADWQQEAFAFLENAPRLDHESPNAAELEGWLRAANSPTPDELPATLARLKALGCKTLERDGHRISVICFHRPDGKLIHLVVADRDVDPALSPDSPVFEGRGKWATVSWAHADRTLMLVTDGTRDDLARYL